MSFSIFVLYNMVIQLCNRFSWTYSVADKMDVFIFLLLESDIQPISKIIFVCDKNQTSKGNPKLDTVGVCWLKILHNL